MIYLCLLPFVLQALLMAVDEFYFHRKRGLPEWEVWGHPLDTVTMALPLGLIAFLGYSEELLSIYIMLAVFSCLFVTKDEFIHTEFCEPMEHWLHSVLFVLHPAAFFAAAYLWTQGEGIVFLKIQFILSLCFLTYQISYWGRHEYQQRHL